MKIGIQTSNILDPLGIEQGFHAIHEAGFDCVDFNIDHCLPYQSIVNGQLMSVFDKSDEDLKEYYRPYKEAAIRYGVAFSQAHAPFPSWVKDRPATNEYVLHAIEKCFVVCEYLNCPYLIVHPFFQPYDDMLSREDEWALNIKQYSRLIPAIKKHHVTVCLENMFTTHRGKVYASICQNPEEASRYIDTLNDIAGEKCFAFCLDVGHSLLVGNDIYAVILGLGNRIETLHLHDNDGRTDQHIAPYMGILDWDRFCQGMREIGYKGVLSFETFAVLHRFDQELLPECLRLIAAAGHMFARRIEQST